MSGPAWPGGWVDMRRSRPKGKIQKKIITAWFFLLLAGTVCGSGAAWAGEEEFPFQAGEELAFGVSWGGVSVGRAVLRVLEGGKGAGAWHFRMTVKTNSFADLFYKVRDRIDGYADPKMGRSLLYTKRQRGRRRRDVMVRFDWSESRTRYISFGGSKRVVPLRPGAFDPLSVFYAFRLRELKEGGRLRAAVSDGKKCVEGNARVIRRERVAVPLGTFDTFLVVPDLRDLGGVFEKSRNARLEIWVTADRRKIPVRVRSKVVVGSFVAELVSARGLIPFR